MLIIPVIDLSRGLVVHAKKGLRRSYQPISSVISSNAEPENVIDSLFELYPFKTIYIADLDAIQMTGTQNKIISRLASQYKDCEFWLDAGINPIQDKNNGYSNDNIKLILGSENKLTKQHLISLLKDNPSILLSLDFDEHELIENDYLLESNSLWPEDVIVMTLSRIGSNNGFDKQCLNNILSLAKNSKVYAAGGIRNMEDIEKLKLMNVSGALVATALHNGAITKEDLLNFFDK